MTRPRVVIVGGGFGGLTCARKLERKPVDVLLVDENDYHLFTPLLYQVATALLDASDIAFPYRRVFRRSPNVRFRMARVGSVDFDGKRLLTEAGHEIAYDYLVLASGSTNNYFGNPDLAKFTIGMKTLEEALRLRNHVLMCLERAAQESDEVERRRWLTFVVVGGGPTGVEYAGALGELLRFALGRDYPEIEPAMATIILVEGKDRLITEFPEKLSRYAERALGKRGVQVRTSTRVGSADALSVTLGDGTEIGTRTIVWAAGVRPADPTGQADLPRSHSERLQVDERLQVSGASGAYAIGDVASVAAGGGELPMLSPPAMQGGRYVARRILNAVERGTAAATSGEPFRYRDKGTMATIGRSAAVGQVKDLRFTGFIGWIAWLFVHLYYLVGFRNRLVAMLTWGMNYLRKDRPIRLIIRGVDFPTTDDPSGSTEGGG